RRKILCVETHVFIELFKTEAGLAFEHVLDVCVRSLNPLSQSIADPREQCLERSVSSGSTRSPRKVGSSYVRGLWIEYCQGVLPFSFYGSVVVVSDGRKTPEPCRSVARRSEHPG